MGLLNAFKSLVSRVPNKNDVRERFEFTREAISGTMSRFYRARERSTGHVYGLKILDREKLKAFEARFKGLKKPSEGEVAASLSHQHIVKTFEHGVTPQGEQFLLMEFLEGPGLNSILIERNEKILSGIRAQLIRSVAEALAAVHAAGYIHRDICPRNVMIEPNTGTLKLIDFGLAVPATAEFMQPGNRTGTPNYMAPELVKRRPTDHRLDIFSFGVTAYEMLTFQLPWERGNTGQVAMLHANHPPIEITHYRPQVDIRLARAIHKCIEREPAKRFEQMHQFLRAIRDVAHEDEA